MARPGGELIGKKEGSLPGCRSRRTFHMVNLRSGNLNS
jgi:hypothetical protein